MEGEAALELRVPAVEIQQRGGRVYVMGLDGKVVPRFATITRLKRSAGALAGYQRPEALAHVRAIREYLESKKPLVPNAVVLAFNSVRVEYPAVAEGLNYATACVLCIPLPGPETPEEEYPAFIVDGQQRLAAVRESAVESFPLAVCGFIAEGLAQQTEQFMLVNNVKPLPRSLLHELLPATQTHLPEHLERRRLPATLLERLNQEKESPLYRLIITQTNPRAAGGRMAAGATGLMQDTAFLKALEHSLSDGALYAFSERRAPDVDTMFEVLCRYWRAVAEVFPQAWGKSPKQSRLMHGAGVVAASFLMDAICGHLRVSLPTQAQFVAELERVADDCAWTAGHWHFPPPEGKRPWNAVQNTSQDVRTLSMYLTGLYMARTRSVGRRK